MEVTQEKWTEITVTVDTKDIETAGNIANMVVPYGIYIEDYSDLEHQAIRLFLGEDGTPTAAAREEPFLS